MKRKIVVYWIYIPRSDVGHNSYMTTSMEQAEKLFRKKHNEKDYLIAYIHDPELKEF